MRKGQSESKSGVGEINHVATGERRRISYTKDFQIIHVATPLLGRGHDSPLLSRGQCMATSFRRAECGKGREEQVEEHDRHYRSQASKANTNSHESW